ncbi:MAG: YaeQ family protein [Usitatibacteraceae bacterium]
MALKATVHKVDLAVSDMDRGYYGSHALTVARHPSETSERMMVRLVAFAMFADEALAFGRGLSADDEPALWLKDLTGNIERWIDVGLPDERELRKACGRARRVVLVTYGGRGVGIWWNQNQGALARHDNLDVIELPIEATTALAKLADRNMQINATLQDGHIWMGNGAQTVLVEPVVLKRSVQLQT